MVKFRIVALTCAVLAAPMLLQAQREKIPPDDLDIVEKNWPNAKKSNTGIRYIVEEAGIGGVINPGDIVTVDYTGRFLNGKIFDHHTDNIIHPFSFRVGRGVVIEGWDQILQLMSPGAKWLVIVPPELAYGRRGSPPRIPADATLVFEIEVVTVQRNT